MADQLEGRFQLVDTGRDFDLDRSTAGHVVLVLLLQCRELELLNAQVLRLGRVDVAAEQVRGLENVKGHGDLLSESGRGPGEERARGYAPVSNLREDVERSVSRAGR